jgi:hypothetical protein
MLEEHSSSIWDIMFYIHRKFNKNDIIDVIHNDFKNFKQLHENAKEYWKQYRNNWEEQEIAIG